MPILKQLTCRVETGPDNIPLTEYSTRYKDGLVDTYIKVPDTPDTFSIHLTSNGYIAPGLAMFVFMDGFSQCNRNRRGLVIPDGISNITETEIDFRVRQKEERVDEKQFIGRDWTFAQLNTVAADNFSDTKKDVLKSVGTIEVVVLRCDGQMLPSTKLTKMIVRPKASDFPLSIDGACETPRKTSMTQADIGDNALDGLDAAFERHGIFDYNLPQLDGHKDHRHRSEPCIPSLNHGHGMYPQVVTPQVYMYPPPMQVPPVWYAGVPQGYQMAYQAANWGHRPSTNQSSTPRRRRRKHWNNTIHSWSSSTSSTETSLAQNNAQDGKGENDQQQSGGLFNTDINGNKPAKNDDNNNNWNNTTDHNINDWNKPADNNLGAGNVNTESNKKTGWSVAGFKQHGTSNQGTTAMPKRNIWVNNTNNDKWSVTEPASGKNEASGNKSSTSRHRSTHKSKSQLEVLSCGGSTLVSTTSSQPYVKSYWQNWMGAPPGQTQDAGLSMFQNLYISSEEPLLTVPESMVQEKNKSHQVRAGKGKWYHHSTSTPQYIDSMQRPYAIFVFRYRSRDALEKLIPGVKIKKDRVSLKERLNAMTKEEVMAYTLRIKKRAGSAASSSDKGSSDDARTTTTRHASASMNTKKSHRAKSTKGVDNAQSNNNHAPRGNVNDNNQNSGDNSG